MRVYPAVIRVQGLGSKDVGQSLSNPSLRPKVVGSLNPKPHTPKP